MERYDVIWIDDEANSEDMAMFIARAKRRGLDIHYALCADDAEVLLNNDKYSWDAIIVDVNCKISNNDASESKDSFYENMDIVKKYCHTKPTPWFVFTAGTFEGGMDSVKYSRREVSWKTTEKGYYNKLIDSDVKELFSDIVESVSNSSEWITKSKYKKVLDIMDEIGCASKRSFLDVLMNIEGFVKPITQEAYYTQLRMIVEQMFRHANKIGLLHDKCVSGKVNLTESNHFLAKNPAKICGVKCQKAHFPKLVADNVKNLLFITGGASHTTEPDADHIINMQKYWNETQTPYLLYAQTLILCDILVWYKQYADSNNNYANNVALWEDIAETKVTPKEICSDSYTGIVGQDEKGNYHCDGYILPYNKAKDYLGKTITITKCKPNDNPQTNGRYEMFAFDWK